LLSLAINQNDFNDVWKLLFEDFIKEFLLFLKDKLVLFRKVIELLSEHILSFFKPDVIIVFKILNEFIQPVQRLI